MKMYFENRKAKGFNVVQLVFLQFHGEKNFYGDSAYHDRSLEHPAETPGKDPANLEQYDFWDHADYAVSLAAQNGIYLAIAPTWGQLVKRDEQYSPEKATRFASLLAGRYKGQPNIIWLIGGAIPGDMKKEVWEAMGSTIKKTAPGHLVTFHPFGRTQSSTWFQQSAWMDFNMYVSGHRNYRSDTPKNLEKITGDMYWMILQKIRNGLLLMENHLLKIPRRDCMIIHSHTGKPGMCGAMLTGVYWPERWVVLTDKIPCDRYIKKERINRRVAPPFLLWKHWKIPAPGKCDISVI